MSVDLLERPASAEAGPGTGNGGVPARRAMVRWAWRLFRREWRQQFLILALIIVAVAATFVGAAVATNAPAPAKAGFGTAGALATFQGSGKHANAPLSATQAAADIAQVQHRFGRVDVIENETFAIPGSIDTYSLRAQNPRGAFGQPMLSLVSGHYPSGPGQVAMTQGLASTFNVRAGDTWHGAGQSWHVVGIVQNPQSLLDEFALVAPGQVTSPSQVSVLFNAPGVDVTRLGHNYQTPQSATSGNVFNPETIVFAVATVGMLLIALVAVGGFTVLAQRRLRSIGMLGALGATDRNIKLVVKANGAVVGVVGTFLGAALGLVAWLLYRPHAESSSHHLIGAFTLPWAVIIPSMIVAIVATYLAASRPARSITKVPIVTALSGRPAPPRQIHRSAIPGVLVMVLAILLLSYAGSIRGGGGAPEVIFGLVSLIVALILLSPLSLTALAKVTRRTPIAVRLAVRDLARYRARSGSALSAISLGVLIAVLVCVLAAARYGNVLDYAGPNLASNQLVVYPPNSGPGQGVPGGGSPSTPTPSVQAMAQSAHNLGASLGTQDVVALVATDANLQHAAGGRQFGGQVYVATPSLLKAFGIAPSQVDPKADVLSMRPGLSTLSLMQLAVRQRWWVEPRPHQHRTRAGAGTRLWGSECLLLFTRLLCGQSGHPRGQRPAVRDVGTQHPDHRARGPSTALVDPDGRLAHPGRTAHYRDPDHQRPAGGGHGGPDLGIEEQSTVVVRDHQLGHRLRPRSGAGHPRHDARAHPERDRGRPAHPECNGRQLVYPPCHHRGDGGCPRTPRRAGGHGRGVCRCHRLFQQQCERRPVIAHQQRPGAEPSRHPGRHADDRGGRRLAPVRPPA